MHRPAFSDWKIVVGDLETSATQIDGCIAKARPNRVEQSIATIQQ